MPASAIQDTLQECIDHCILCYRNCTETAMLYSLKAGGKHSEPNPIRLMFNCVGMCRTAAEFMMSNLELHRQVCAVCAEVCEACAESCEEVGDMVDCVSICRTCADSCRIQAATTPSTPRLGAGGSTFPAGHSTMPM